MSCRGICVVWLLWVCTLGTAAFAESLLWCSLVQFYHKDAYLGPLESSAAWFNTVSAVPGITYLAGCAETSYEIDPTTSSLTGATCSLLGLQGDSWQQLVDGWVCLRLCLRLFPLHIVRVAFAEFSRWTTKVEGCQHCAGEFCQEQCALER